MLRRKTRPARTIRSAVVLVALLVVGIVAKGVLSPSGLMHPFSLAPAEAARRQAAVEKYNRAGVVVEPMNPWVPHTFCIDLPTGQLPVHEVDDMAQEAGGILGTGFTVHIYDHAHTEIKAEQRQTAP